MTDSKLFLLDAEYWFMARRANPLNPDILIPYIPRLAFLETKYGKCLDANGMHFEIGRVFSKTRHEGYMWFSLLLSEVLK